MSESLNLDDYIAKLEMVVDIHRMRENELERVVQLINKTNQFNVTTKRYTISEIEEIAVDNHNAIYVVYSYDKYGSNGLISVVILKELNTKVFIDTFLMSCRVMGRKLENVIINELVSKCNGKRLRAEFLPTAKNAPVKDLYDRLGFSLIDDVDGYKIYELDTKRCQKKEFTSYKEIKFEE